MKLGFHLAVAGVVIALSLTLLLYPAVTLGAVMLDSQLRQTGESCLVPARWLVGFTEMPRGSREDLMDVDSGPVFCEFGSVASAFGIGAAKAVGRFDHAAPLTLEAGAGAWPTPFGMLIPGFMGRVAVDSWSLGEVALHFSMTRPTYLDESQWRVFADVVPCLASLQRLGWTHCILWYHVPELPQFVHALGLSPFFAAVSSSGNTGYEKPHLEAFRGLLRQFPSACTAWMIGDSVTADVQGAERVGIPAILVRRKQDGAKYCCDSLAQIEGILSAQAVKATS
jgi:hypothetical protein